MHLPRLLAFIVLCCAASCIPAQTVVPTQVPTSQAVFSGGTAYIITVTDPTSLAKVGVGLSANLLVSVAPVNHYDTPVKLTCSNLPVETSCSFAVQTIPAGGGSTALSFNTAAPHDCGSSKAYFYGSSASLRYLGPVLAGMLMLWLPRRRIWLRGLVSLLAVSSSFGLAGCGHCTDLGTRPGTYTFLLNGTAVGTNALALGDLVTVPITVYVQY